MADAARPGEFELIARYFAPIAGPGGLGLLDDAALLTPPEGCDLVLSKDVLVAGVHFFPDDPPMAIAMKALRVNLSDLAAKGAEPMGFLLGLGLPDGWTADWMEEFARGLALDSAHFRCPLLGGDTVKSHERLFLSVTVIGQVPAGTMVRRSGGRVGDLLYVTGIIGASTMGLSLRLDTAAAWAVDLSPAMRSMALSGYLTPNPANALTGAIRTHAVAGMDVSDGLIGDAAKLAGASGCGLEIDARCVPLATNYQAAIRRDAAFFEQVLTGGDDYQVLAAIPPDRAEAFEAAARDIAFPVTRIGRLTERGLRVIGLDGTDMTFAKMSFGHF